MVFKEVSVDISGNLFRELKPVAYTSFFTQSETEFRPDVTPLSPCQIALLKSVSRSRVYKQVSKQVSIRNNKKMFVRMKKKKKTLK